MRAWLEGEDWPVESFGFNSGMNYGQFRPEHAWQSFELHLPLLQVNAALKDPYARFVRESREDEPFEDFPSPLAVLGYPELAELVAMDPQLFADLLQTEFDRDLYQRVFEASASAVLINGTTSVTVVGTTVVLKGFATQVAR